MKKTMALLLSIVMVMSTFVCGGVALADEETSSLSVTRSSVILLVNNNSTYDNNAQVSGDRRSFVSFDFTGKEAQLYAATAMTITAEARYSTNLIQDIGFYVVDDAVESSVNTSLTYTQAASDGIWTGGTAVAQRTATSDASEISLAMDAEAVKTALGSGNNSLLVLRAQLISGYSHNAQLNPNTIKIDLTYPANYVAALADGMQWSDISTQDINDVKEDISLPSKYKGCDVSWTSDNDTAIESDGTVHLTSSQQTATLTATLSADGITAVKTFGVTIPAKTLPTSSIVMSNGATIMYGDNTDKSFWGTMQADRDRRSFALFDLTGHEAELYGATGIKISGSRVGNSSWHHMYSFSVYALDESKEQYITNTLTYTNGSKYLWEGGDLLAQRTDDADAASFELNADKAALIKAFESGTDGVVAVRIQPIGDTTSGNSQFKADLTITFTYDDECEDYKNYLQTRVNNLSWASISEQSQSRVYKDIDLPATLDGNNIIWTSDNDSVITSDGKVTNGDTLRTATLTATVGEYSKKFEVAVTPEFYVDTPVAEVNEGVAEVVFASYNALASDREYVGIIAVYDGNELKAVKVENINSIAGKSTVSPFTMTGIGSGCKVKAFAWNTMENAVPLCINAE